VRQRARCALLIGQGNIALTACISCDTGRQLQQLRCILCPFIATPPWCRHCSAWSLFKLEPRLIVFLGTTGKTDTAGGSENLDVGDRIQMNRYRPTVVVSKLTAPVFGAH